MTRQILTFTVLATLAIPLFAGEPIFTPIKIDGPEHDPAAQSYWFGPFSECASVLDVDGDGDLDIAAGRNWYEAPHWTRHDDFRGGAETNGPETDNNSEFALDVNRDGRTDIVASGWMRMKGAFWYENPGRRDSKWTSRRIHSAYSMEGVIHGDIDADGDEDILVNHWSLIPGQGMTWLEAIDREPWFVEHVIGTEGERHGNGLGDINGDGVLDIVTTLGWWEAPPKPAEGKWTWHPDFKFAPSGSHPLLVHDVNEDGHNDIIMGAAHDYGLVWYEQKVDGGQRSFTEHWIEKDHGGFHTMALGDLNGDGRADLVTGKRLFPHHGRDISAYEPLFVFWYNIRDGQFERHVLAYNHLPWSPGQFNLHPAPNYAIGVGMKINIQDIDHDGDNDVVLAGKGGLYILDNQGPRPKPRPRQILPPEDAYTSWQQWFNQPGGAPSKWVALFDGTDLNHWQTPSNPEHWVVKNGVLSLTGRNDTKMLDANYLWTKEKYGDFILELEYKVPPGRANSGVFIRTSDLADPVQTGMEVQVGNPNPDRPLSTRVVGGVYDLAAPRKQVHQVGEWNRYRITCKGPYVSVMLNGVQVSDANLDYWTEPRQNPDGSRNKFRRALKDFAREGYIGFQDHGTPVSYRNVRIRRLD